MEGAGTTLAVKQRRATSSGDACFEELVALDRELSRLARCAGALRFAVSLGLEAMAKGGYRELGFPSMVAYGRERCERRARWTEQSLALARRSAVLPLLRGALLSGLASWSKAVIIARAASPADEAKWLAAASTLSVKKLRERTRSTTGAKAEVDDEEGAEADDEARCTLTVTVNTEEAWLFECATLMVRHLDGQGAPVANVVEAAIGEGMTSLLPRVPREAREPPDDDAAARRRMRTTRSASSGGPRQKTCARPEFCGGQRCYWKAALNRPQRWTDLRRPSTPRFGAERRSWPSSLCGSARWPRCSFVRTDGGAWATRRRVSTRASGSA